MFTRKQTYSFSVRPENIADFVNAVMGAELHPTALRVGRYVGARRQQIDKRWSAVRTHHGEAGLMVTFTAKVHDLTPAGRQRLLTRGGLHAEITEEDPH